MTDLESLKALLFLTFCSISIVLSLLIINTLNSVFELAIIHEILIASIISIILGYILIYFYKIIEKIESDEQ